jgi:hypothetical protein
MKLEKPADVRQLITKFINEMNSEGFKIPQPGAVANFLNIWLRCYEMETNNEMEQRLKKLEEKVKEVSHEKREREYE